jgi:hypothetical protein
VDDFFSSNPRFTNSDRNWKPENKNAALSIDFNNDGLRDLITSQDEIPMIRYKLRDGKYSRPNVCDLSQYFQFKEFITFFRRTEQ